MVLISQTEVRFGSVRASEIYAAGIGLAAPQLILGLRPVWQTADAFGRETDCPAKLSANIVGAPRRNICGTAAREIFAPPYPSVLSEALSGALLRLYARLSP